MLQDQEGVEKKWWPSRQHWSDEEDRPDWVAIMADDSQHTSPAKRCRFSSPSETSPSSSDRQEQCKSFKLMAVSVLIRFEARFFKLNFAFVIRRQMASGRKRPVLASWSFAALPFQGAPLDAVWKLFYDTWMSWSFHLEAVFLMIC